MLLSLLLLVGLLPVGASAAGGSLALEAGSVTASAEAGTTVRVPVNATANSGYGSGVLTVSWNKTALELKDVEYSALAPKGFSAAIQNTGKYIIDFGDVLATENFTGTGTFFTLVFEVRSGAQKGDYTVSLSDFDVYDKDIEPLTVTGKDGTVTLTDAPTVTLTGITITKAPAKTAYTEGESFDKSGMEVTAKYSDGSTAKVTDYELSPTGALKTSDESVTVSYTEGEVTVKAKQTVTVKAEPAVLKGIEISAPPAKTEYTEGESFDASGMEVTAKYSDGSLSVVTDYTFSPSGALKTSDESVTVSYTEGEEIGRAHV